MQLRSEVLGVRASTCEFGGQSPTRTFGVSEGHGGRRTLAREPGGPDPSLALPTSREATAVFLSVTFVDISVFALRPMGCVPPGTQSRSCGDIALLRSPHPLQGPLSPSFHRRADASSPGRPHVWSHLTVPHRLCFPSGGTDEPLLPSAPTSRARKGSTCVPIALQETPALWRLLPSR